MRLLIISHALIQEHSQMRWRRLVAKYPDVHVRLLVPEYWRSTWFSNSVDFIGKPVRESRFEVVPMGTTNKHAWWRYLLKGLAGQLREYRPDIIFCIHEEQILQLQQTILYRRLFAPKAKLIYFSMNAFDRVLRPQKASFKDIAKYLWSSILWFHVQSGTDGALVHCPPILKKMHAEGYQKPILLQTQIGVDEKVFHPDQIERATIRETLGLNGFVIGFAGRLLIEKGVIDLLKACEDAPKDWKLLFIGDGPCRNIIEEWAKNNYFENRVHITGYVPVNEVAKYMRAMDVFVLGTHTDKNKAYWDMFPLVVPQAMATSLPTVVANGGGLAYQVGEQEGLLFEEGDHIQLRALIEKLYYDPAFRTKESQRLMARSLNLFCIPGMNDQFKQFLHREIIKEHS